MSFGSQSCNCGVGVGHFRNWLCPLSSGLGVKSIVFACYVARLLIKPTPDDGDRDGCWKVRHYLHSDTADCPKRLHCVWVVVLIFMNQFMPCWLSGILCRALYQKEWSWKAGNVDREIKNYSTYVTVASSLYTPIDGRYYIYTSLRWSHLYSVLLSSVCFNQNQLSNFSM